MKIFLEVKNIMEKLVTISLYQKWDFLKIYSEHKTLSIMTAPLLNGMPKSIETQGHKTKQYNQRKSMMKQYWKIQLMAINDRYQPTVMISP